tara:strand:+ start:2568 stop:2705 length:138 start_codon:yes stop_codon:yes gene_type:complete
MAGQKDALRYLMAWTFEGKASKVLVADGAVIGITQDNTMAALFIQ